jgi:putative MATE family efflux protein
VTREVLRLASFAIISSFLQTFVFVVDRALLGHHSGTALGQMQISGTLEWSVFAVFNGVFAATFARIGRHVGAKDRARATAAARVSVGVALVFGLVLTLLTPLVLALLPRLAPHATRELIVEARSYLGTTLAASPLVFVGAASFAALQAGGDTKTPLLIGVVANSVHIALNWVLVLGAFGVPAMGARGAGIGTAITFGVETTLAVLALMRRPGPTRNVSLRGAPPPGSIREEIGAIYSIGGPAMAEKVVYQSGFLLFVAIIAALGDRVMEANQLLIGLESICFLSADGFAIATAALVAQKIGAREEGAAPRVARSATISAVALLGVIGLVYLALRHPLLSIFSNDAETVEVAAGTMWVLALAQPFMAAGQVLAAAMRGAGRTGVVFGVSSLGAFVVRLSCTYVLAFPLRLGLVGVWLGSTSDWFVRTVVLALLAWRGTISAARTRSSDTARSRGESAPTPS